MDISVIDYASPAEEGRFFHMTHPAHGHLLYEGPGACPDTAKLIDEGKEHHKVGMTIRGWHSDTVQAVLGKLDAEDLQREKKLSADEQKARFQERGEQLAMAVIVKFHHVAIDGKNLEPNADDIRRLMGVDPTLEKKVLRFSRDNSHFFMKGSPSS